ncbi:MAG: ABC transporter substrate-binding protein [Oscillospiraceae bacterium]|nr:ABC transporter substrate-binding protein [Oscillospiraceae bacterium]
MSKSRRILAMALSATMGLTMLAGCNNSGTSSTPNNTSSGNQSTPNNSGNSGDASNGKVYWLNFKPEADGTLQEIAKTYKDQKGVDVKVVTAASGSYSQTLTAEMDKSNPPTIFNVGNALGVKDWKDFALDLKGTAIANELNSDASNLYDETGKLVSIPYAMECYGIIVNKDLVEQAGHNVADIKNFETLKTVVEDIHSRASELGFDAFTSCDMDSSSSWRFTGHMINLEYFYEQKDNHWTECPATISGDYVDKFKNLYDLCVDNSISTRAELATGGHDPSQQFKDKKAAFTVQGSWEYSGIVEAGLTNVTMIPYYCGVEGEEKAGLNSGTENCWAINSKVSEADQQATMDFLVWCVTDPDTSAKLVKEFGAMPYKSAAASENAFLAAANDYANDGCYTMNWATNFQPNVDEYRNVFVSALNAYNANPSDTTWEAVKTAIVAGWATQYNAINS